MSDRDGSGFRTNGLTSWRKRPEQTKHQRDDALRSTSEATNEVDVT